ncbi:MAG: ankyrin repeat domain-containing protein [Bacteroidota bacterium]
MAAGDWKDLLLAAQNGDIELVKYHIKEGVNPNYQHPELLTTPLIVSIENTNIEVTKFLLENGADPHLKAGFSTDSPMIVAKRLRNKEAMKLLEPYCKSFLQWLFLKI